jgi:hypothetical protein
MATQLAKLAVDLGTVRERQMRYCVGEFVQPVNLPQQCRAALCFEGCEED